MHFKVFIFLLLLTIASANELPSLTIFNITSPIYERSPVGTVIGYLVATDRDPNEELTIEIDNKDTEDLVNLTAQTGTPSEGIYVTILLAVSDLDKDYNPQIRHLYFKVFDKDKNTATLRVSMFITDINDEKPIFTNLPYRLSVPENEIIGSTVFNVSSEDKDQGYGGLANYSLSDPLNLENPFTISNVHIILSTKLNYSINSFYQLKVHATDREDPFNEAESVDLIVNVIDVQNMPPYFLNLPYTKSIQENEKLGTHVLTVLALDGDRGVPNNIQYSIVEEEYNFTINSTTGEISVNGELDADDEDVKQKGGVFRLTVNASEIIPNEQKNYGETWSTTTVSIILTDVNDNIPLFSQNLYEATIAENSPRGVPLTMINGLLIEVYDRDQTPDHHSFELVMDDGNVFPAGFDTLPAPTTPIYSKSTVILKVNDSEILDYETRTNVTFKLIARALNSNESTSTTILVHIQDVNDNSPVFTTNHTTQFEVHENVATGTPIDIIAATDAESEVRYSLDDDNENIFHIDSTTGNLTVNGPLDREYRTSYTLFVIATDTDTDPNQERSTRLRITISILDVNDNAPEFTHLPSRQIPENAAPGTEVITVRATDKDIGINEEIVYSLTTTGNISGLYIDGDSGLITVNSSLLGMSGDRYFTVMAKDKGEPSMNSTVIINITVTDVNLNLPIFYEPSHTDYNISENIIPEVHILEEQPQDSFIFTFYANDSDIGNNGAVSYRLNPDGANDWQRFDVDRGNGNLTNFKPLDREERESYLISVSAVDSGIPSLESTIQLKVILIDIDDNEPVFDDTVQQPYLLYVKEEQGDKVVGNLSLASDKDSIPRICYYIKGGELVDHFSLNKSSGILSVIKPLDREDLDQVNLVIQVSGDCFKTIQPNTYNRDSFIRNRPPEYDPSNNTLLWVQINILDVNDQPPVFASDKLTSGFLYDIEFGTIVKELGEDVSDNDVGKNAVTYFKLLGPITTKEMDNFVVNPNDPPLILDVNGTIKTNMLFSSDMTGAFVLNIQAYDIGNLTDEATLEIYLISDIQRLKIVFQKTPDEVRALKNDIIRELEDLLKFRIIVDKIATHQASDGVPVITKSDMFIHARYLDTDKVVPAQELWRAFDFTENVNLILDKYGVIQTVPVIQQQIESESLEETLKKSLIIVTVSLAIIAVLLILILINLRSRYRRKLRAANTKTFGAVHSAIPDLIQPGTNKYFAAASNPIYMKEVNLNLAEDSVSRNSIDDNAVGDRERRGISFEPEEQEVVMSLYDERAQELKDKNRSPALDFVLMQYEEVLKTKSKNDDTQGDTSQTHITCVEDLEQTDI